MVKTNAELVMADPILLARFHDLLVERATVVGINIEIAKISERLRIQLEAARVCGLDASKLLNYCREKKHVRLLVFAHAVGQERGQRLGREAGQRKILEAQEFAELQTANAAPFSDKAKLTDED